MTQNRPARDSAGTRRRILDSAEVLARRLGPANLSLDAVAAEAGVSKGGLLYHYPSKAKLLEGLVADHLERLDRTLRAEEETGRRDAVIIAYLRQFLRDQDLGTPPPSGLLAVLAENPQLLEPIKRHEEAVLARIRTNARDPDFATTAYLAVLGLRCTELLGTLPLPRDAAGLLVEELLTRVKNRTSAD